MTEPSKPDRPKRIWRATVLRVALVGLCFGVWYLILNPKSPLTNAWHPLTPLSVQDAVTPLTKWKLRRALATAATCHAALETSAIAKVLPDLNDSAQCNIRPQVRLSAVGAARLTPVNTRCQTALRLAMWERHGIQPAARRHLNAEVHEITHFSSYNCRAMRTSSGVIGRMSTHATADAIDISGFVLAGGKRLSLLKNWDGTAAEQAFFRDVRDTACTWFRVTLSPDYNALHADHFHLQHTGWGLCR